MGRSQLRIYATSGRYREAIEQWQAILRVQPGNNRVQELVRMARGELERADG